MRYLLGFVLSVLAFTAEAGELPIAQTPQYDAFLDLDKLRIDPQNPATYQFTVRIAFKQTQTAAGVSFNSGLAVNMGRCATLETAEVTSMLMNNGQTVVSKPVNAMNNLQWARLDDANPGTHTLNQICRAVETPCAQLRGDQYKVCREKAVLALREQGR